MKERFLALIRKYSNLEYDNLDCWNELKKIIIPNQEYEAKGI